MDALDQFKQQEEAKSQQQSQQHVSQIPVTEPMNEIRDNYGKNYQNFYGLDAPPSGDIVNSA